MVWLFDGTVSLMRRACMVDEDRAGGTCGEAVIMGI
jgi:hypothetical protein